MLDIWSSDNEEEGRIDLWKEDKGTKAHTSKRAEEKEEKLNLRNQKRERQRKRRKMRRGRMRRDCLKPKETKILLSLFGSY